MNFEIALSNLISDEEKPTFDVLAVLACAHPTILCLKYGGLIILIEDIILNCISLRLHNVLTPHHHPENICDAYQFRSLTQDRSEERRVLVKYIH